MYTLFYIFSESRSMFLVIYLEICSEDIKFAATGSKTFVLRDLFWVSTHDWSLVYDFVTSLRLFRIPLINMLNPDSLPVADSPQAHVKWMFKALTSEKRYLALFDQDTTIGWRFHRFGSSNQLFRSKTRKTYRKNIVLLHPKNGSPPAKNWTTENAWPRNWPTKLMFFWTVWGVDCERALSKLCREMSWWRVGVIRKIKTT